MSCGDVTLIGLRPQGADPWSSQASVIAIGLTFWLDWARVWTSRRWLWKSERSFAVAAFPTRRRGFVRL